ncbi:MAG: hypothetical protein R3E01_13930 [Pirellulaceae bacterium]|nr:hypothetical protein [Planctomycetales bacterium]
MRIAFKRWAMATMALLVSASVSQAAIDVFEVFPAYAPDTASPSWGGYVTNAINELMSTTPASSSRADDPTAYELATGPIAPNEMIITPFLSWRGQADPTVGWDDGSSTAGVFGNESGNRVHFGVRILTDGNGSIKLADLLWDKNWYDAPFNTPSTLIDFPNESGNFAASDYSATRVGVLYGGDGMLGGGDDTLITSGAGTQEVDALFYVGIGDAFFSDNPGALSDQDDLDITLDAIHSHNCPQDLEVTYSLGDATGTGVVHIVPEPSSMMIGLTVLLGMVAGMRRRTVK